MLGWEPRSLWLQNPCIEPLGYTAFSHCSLCFLWTLLSCSQRSLSSLLSCCRLIVHSRWESVFYISYGFPGPICSSISCKPCAGSSTLGPPDASRWEKVTLSSGQPGLSTKRGKIISRDQKKKFSLKNCFCRAVFSDVKSTFFVNLLSVAESGRVGTGLFYLPKTIHQTNSGDPR